MLLGVPPTRTQHAHLAARLLARLVEREATEDEPNESRAKWLAAKERSTLYTIYNVIIGTEPLCEQVEE